MFDDCSERRPSPLFELTGSCRPMRSLTVHHCTDHSLNRGQLGHERIELGVFYRIIGLSCPVAAEFFYFDIPPLKAGIFCFHAAEPARQIVHSLAWPVVG